MGSTIRNFISIFLLIMASFQVTEAVELDQNIIDQENIKHQLRHEKSSFMVQSADIPSNRLIVHVEDGAQLPANLALLEKPADYDVLAERGLYFLEVKEGEDTSKARSVLLQLEEVQKVEYDQVNQFQMDVSDPFYTEQQDYLEKMGFVEAWEQTTGSSDVTIGVLDTGVDAHADLQDRLQDGYNTLEDSSDSTDAHGHGTQVTGVIAANPNNKGLIGVDHQVNIVPFKISEGKDILTSEAVKAVYEAIDRGVDILNMSFAGTGQSEAFKEALYEAYQEDILLIASSGNNNTTLSTYPAAYPWVLGVGSVDTEVKRSSFSNYGDWLDITAVGESIITTNLDDRYSYVDGTSIATPFVTGLASLLKEKNPDWSAGELTYAIQASAQSSEEWGLEVGYGMIDAANALSINDIPSPQTVKSFSLGESVSDKIETPMETDTYHFRLEAEEEVMLDVQDLPKALDVVLVLRKREDQQLEEIATVDEARKGGTESWEGTLEEGDYYVSIYDYNQHWSKDAYQVQMASESKSYSIPRIKGSTRIETAVEIAKLGWPTGADTAILATSSNFPDALAGTPLAYQLDAPILLTDDSQLSKATKEELARLQVNNVVILGGTGAISEEVEQDVTDMDMEVERIGGIDREKTAQLIAQAVESNTDEPVETAVVVYSRNFPDALSIAPYAAMNQYPVLLTNKNSVPESTEDYLADMENTIVIGGEGVISKEVYDQLPSPERISGTDRYETMEAIHQTFGTSRDHGLIATGSEFADALTGSVLSAKLDQPLLLVRPDEIPTATRNAIDLLNIQQISILGGDIAVNQSVEEEWKTIKNE
ncbi:cell wall-binding repeat-containing protein [Gracilibacillus sp. YIM 98692]|uniref:cell wall-binding repeat-containing protein n=1 Tax=Gracilibacillus sp. YIM 98692 TaxID=2663532 RepID=UPI0013D2DC56|nr:cell wall-binding repeat-containing protein [Gracilibacillus sp. YIM 98692]